MRSSFRGYYSPSRDELTNLWNNGLIILDTNVLLNLYRYTADTREGLLTVLAKFSQNLWLPHRVAEEYHKLRLSTILEQRKAYDNVSQLATSSIATLKGEISKYRRHPVLEVDSLIQAIDQLHESLVSLISAQERRHSEVATFTLQRDDVLNKLTALYEGRIGSSYDEAKLAEIAIQGELRYASKVPPGYMDRNKSEPEKYGDLILWMQILDHAKEVQRPIILVTDDVKEDWWLRSDGQTIGPRPELIMEMQEQTAQLLHMYRAEQFARYARDHAKAGISESALSEIDHLSTKQDEERRIVEKARRLVKDRQQGVAQKIEHLQRSVSLYEAAVQQAQEFTTSPNVFDLKRRRQIAVYQFDQLMERVHQLYAEREILNHQKGKPADEREWQALSARYAESSLELGRIEEEHDALKQEILRLDSMLEDAEVANRRLRIAEHRHKRDVQRLADAQQEAIELEGLLKDPQQND